MARVFCAVTFIVAGLLVGGLLFWIISRYLGGKNIIFIGSTASVAPTTEEADFRKKFIEAVNEVAVLHTKAIQEVDSYHELCEDLVSFEYYYSIPNPIHVRKILGQLLDAQLLSVRAFIIISLLIESAGTKFSNNDHLFNYYDYYDEKSRFNLEQKRMLNSLLDKGIKSMNDTLNPLYRVSESVKEVLEELISLHKQFKIDSDDKSDYFQSELSGMRSYAFDSNVRVSELNRGSIGHDRFLVSELKQELNKVKHQFEDFQNKLELAYSGISLAIGKIESQIMIFGTLKNEIKRFYS